MLSLKDFVSYSPAWSPEAILNAIIVFMWAIYFWETYLTYRQHSIAKKIATVPPELAGVMDQTTFSKARAYHMDKNVFSFIVRAWEQLFMTAVLVFGALPFLWSQSERITSYFGYGKEHEIVQTIVFALVGAVINTILDLPFSLYATFVLEEKHGFNKQTPAFYAKDKVKKFIVMQAIMVPIIACIIYIIKIGGDYFFVYLWLFCCVIYLLLVTVYADYIAPLFDNFTSLDEGPLKEKIHQLAQSINFPLTKIFVIDGSKRSAHSNAYFYGFFKNKRIVLFDTLMQDFTVADKEKSEDKGDEKVEEEKKDPAKPKCGCSNEEITAILAHEFGHWKFNHVLKNFFIVQVNMFVTFAVFSLLYKNKTLFGAFGFWDQMPVVIGMLIILQYVFSPYNEILTFLITVLSRRFEFQADMYAKLLNKAADLRSALVKLNKDNLGFPVYDWLYSAYHHSHPPLLQRIKFLGKID